jgi:hypothetical protein
VYVAASHAVTTISQAFWFTVSRSAMARCGSFRAVLSLREMAS